MDPSTQPSNKARKSSPVSRRVRALSRWSRFCVGRVCARLRTMPITRAVSTEWSEYACAMDVALSLAQTCHLWSFQKFSILGSLRWVLKVPFFFFLPFCLLLPMRPSIGSVFAYQTGFGVAWFWSNLVDPSSSDYMCDCWHVFVTDSNCKSGDDLGQHGQIQVGLYRVMGEFELVLLPVMRD